MPQAQASLSSCCAARSTFSSLLIVLTQNNDSTSPKTTKHTNYTLRTRQMSHISQLSKLAISIAVSITITDHPTLPPVPQQPNHRVCHIILWLAGVVPFSTNGNRFFCLQTLPACGHIHEKKANFYRLFLHQTHSKHDGNVREKVCFSLSGTTVLEECFQKWC